MVHRKGKWISTYWKPSNAILGQTITPNGGRVKEDQDLEKVKDFLKRMRIPYRIRTLGTSKVADMKRWIVIPSKYPLNDMEEQLLKDFATNQTSTFHI